jgi:gamma-glutamyltranspeptidase/glutathione hydrolase
LVVLLVACANDGDKAIEGDVGFVEGFLGGVVADEPQAALVGREVLSSGGTAADAATAMYFTMAVTLPSQASLGGGGLCLVFDGTTGETRALDFLPRPSSRFSGLAERPTAVPAAIRGFYALQARYGRLRWSQLLAPAENQARFGVQVSRAFARDLAQLEPALLAEPSFRRVFASADGTGLVREGDFLVQVELASVISRLRTEGPGPFHSGPQAAAFVQSVDRAGGSLDRQDLADARPVWRETARFPLGDHFVHFDRESSWGGAVAAELWDRLSRDGRFDNASDDEQILVLADQLARAFAATPSVPPRPASENPAAASLVAVDRDGSAAACSVTLNALFGTGRIAQESGILLAAAPGPGGRGSGALGPMLMVNPNVNEFFYASAASGGVAAPGAMIGVAARVLLAGEPLLGALTAPRVLAGAESGQAFIENGSVAGIAGRLSAAGYRVTPVPAIGRVAAIACPEGIPPEPESCAVVADPRGLGLALGSE